MLASRVWAALKARPASEIAGYGVILARNALGLPNRMRTPDRDALEQVILPAYAARPDIKAVLFVGCAWYTHHYKSMLPGREYWTIDPDPWKKRFGARRHIVAGLESVDAHIAASRLDLIICNGVFGWGLFASTLVPALALGLNWEGATRQGAIASMLTGLAVTLLFETLAFFRVYSFPAGVAISGLSLVLSILVFFAVSWLTRTSAPEQLDDDVRMVMDC